MLKSNFRFNNVQPDLCTPVKPIYTAGPTSITNGIMFLDLIDPETW